MRPPRQAYYSSLPGFRNFFREGVPVLLYHKLGLCPAEAVFRALYMSPRFFAGQIRELKEGGFVSAEMGDCLKPGRGVPRVVISFDDGFENVFEHAIKPLAESKFHAIQFLVAGLLGGWNEWDLARGEKKEKLMDEAQVREWIAAGHEIGAHSMTHPYLDRIPPAEAREEIFASKKSLEDRFGAPVKHFCYPYGHRNRVIRDLVEEAGYLTACTADRGINTGTTPRFEIRRWLARHPSVRPKEVLARFLDTVLTGRPGC